MDYTQYTTDPNDYDTSKIVSNYLTSITKIFSNQKSELISSLCTDKIMLDIGAGEHDIKYFNNNWEHAIYQKHASTIMAIDIDQKLCDYYNSIGFNFKCIDATSNFDLGLKFQFIYIVAM